MPIHEDYVRLETDQEKTFYQSPVPLTEAVADEVQGLLERLTEQMAEFKPLTGWRVEDAALARAAEAFAMAVHEVWDVHLSLADEDPTHLDAFLNRYVIAPELRPLFDGAMVREGLSDTEYQAFAEKIERGAIPASEALYYFLGAYWGEWLVRHRGAKWMLHAPLRALQAFPDMITSHGTVCLLPFSQAMKKLADPAGDNLAYKAEVFRSEYLPPYPLLASMADRQEATLALMPQEVRLAEEALAAGDVEDALGLLKLASDREPWNLLLLGQVQQVAWQAEEWDLAHKAMTALLRQHPHARTFYNLGVFYAQFDLLDEAIESMRQAVLLHPQYGRAKLAMATLLAEKGEVAIARGVLQMLLSEGYDSAIQMEAESLLLQLEQSGE